MRSDADSQRNSSVRRGGALFLCVLLLLSCSKLLGLQGGTTQAACTTEQPVRARLRLSPNLGCRNRFAPRTRIAARALAASRRSSRQRAFQSRKAARWSRRILGRVTVACTGHESCDGSVCRTQCTSADECAGRTGVCEWRVCEHGFESREREWRRRCWRDESNARRRRRY